MTSQTTNARPVRTSVAALGIGLAASLLGGVPAYAKSESKTTAFPLAQSGGQLTSIDVRTDGSITIIGTDANEVVVKRVVKQSGRAKSNESVQGTTLNLRGSCKGGITIGASCSVSYEVQIPRALSIVAKSKGSDILLKSVDGKTDADSSGGDVKVEASKGSLRLTTNGGDLRVADVSGPLYLSSGGGSILGEGLRSDAVQASSSGGDTNLAFAGPVQTLRARSGGGNLTVVVPNAEGGYRVKASGGGGDKNVGIAQSSTSQRSIDLGSGGGDLTVKAK